MIPVPYGKKEFAEAATSARGFLRSVIESLPDLVCVLDCERRVLAFNPNMRNLLGKSADGVSGRDTPWFFAESETENYAREDEEAIRQARPLYDRERRVVLPDGPDVRLMMHILPLANREEGVVGLAYAGRDVTAIRKLEQDLRNANMRLSSTLAALKLAQGRIIEHERMNALGEMAGGIAHDFNNALMPILGYSELLINKPELLADRTEALNLLRGIQTAAMDASQTVRRLREFYRKPGEEEKAVGDLNAQVKTAVVLTKPKWQSEKSAEGVRITVETELGEIPSVPAKESQIREVLINLILNALDAMPRDGTLFIRTRAEGMGVELEVTDTGVGMTEEVRRRCLEPFFTTKGEAGSGLGLPLVYGFVQRHRGRMDISSAPGKGTTVRIWLPSVLSGDEAIQERKAYKPVGSLRVLVIDDEMPSRILLKKMLETDGHHVETACDGGSGIRAVAAACFDLVITDRAMPDMNGDEVAVEIAKIRPGLKVIMLTGFGDIMNEEQRKPAGVDAVLPKPVTLAVLRETMANVMSVRTE